MVKVGVAEDGLVKVATLPSGSDVNVQAKVSGLPSTSVDVEPSSVTAAPSTAVVSAPACATGGEFAVDTVTTSGALCNPPGSATINWRMKLPGASTTNEGATAAGFVRVACVPAGPDSSDQA